MPPSTRLQSAGIYVGTMHGLITTATDRFLYVPEINGGKMVRDIRRIRTGIRAGTSPTFTVSYDIAQRRLTQF